MRWRMRLWGEVVIALWRARLKMKRSRREFTVLWWREANLFQSCAMHQMLCCASVCCVLWKATAKRVCDQRGWPTLTPLKYSLNKLPVPCNNNQNQAQQYTLPIFVLHKYMYRYMKSWDTTRQFVEWSGTCTYQFVDDSTIVLGDRYLVVKGTNNGMIITAVRPSFPFPFRFHCYHTTTVFITAYLSIHLFIQ